MKLLANVTVSAGLETLPRLEPSEFHLLWHCDFWDAPLSGMLGWAGGEFWFECIHENPDPDGEWFRRYAVLRLSPEQHAEENRWHDLFRRCVGTHTDYDAQGTRPGKVLPQEKWAEFYDAHRHRTPRDFVACEVVARFER